MNRDDVEYILKEVAAAFNKQPMNHDKIDSFERLMADFQIESRDFIIDRMLAKETLPSNINLAVKQAYHEWLKANPKFAVKFEKTQCNLCNGIGILHRLEFISRFKSVYEFHGRCPNCQNWSDRVGTAMPEMTMENALKAKPENEPFTSYDFAQCRNSISE